MPSFSVEITRTAVHTTSVSITAADEEKATEKAEQMCEDASNGTGALMKISSWDEDSTQFEVGSVDED